ncbi:MAG: pyrroline-5-carboxylate reductase family protein [Butyricicoccaceae bacterium]
MKTYRFGVLGAGSMGKTIAAGAVRAGLFRPDEVLLFNRSEEKRAANRAEGLRRDRRLHRGLHRVRYCAAVGQAAELCRGAACSSPNASAKSRLFWSTAAGISFAKIEAALGADTPIIRAMPNTPLMLGVGATQLVKNAAASEAQLAAVRSLFDAMGVTTVFEHEDMINEAIPYAGSAPAYIYAYADAMVQSAKKHGIDEKDALQMFCQTMIGAAKMLMQGDKTPAELIRAVRSPGGTTLAGMQVLEERDLYGMVAEACDKCTARAYELGK